MEKLTEVSGDKYWYGSAWCVHRDGIFTFSGDNIEIYNTRAAARKRQFELQDETGERWLVHKFWFDIGRYDGKD